MDEDKKAQGSVEPDHSRATHGENKLAIKDVRTPTRDKLIAQLSHSSSTLRHALNRLFVEGYAFDGGQLRDRDDIRTIINACGRGTPLGVALSQVTGVWVS